MVATKGAPDMLLDRVTKIEKHGEVSAFTEDDRTTLMKLNKESGYSSASCVSDGIQSD